MTKENTNEYKQCIFYCWGGYCNRNYNKEVRDFGWSSVTEYPCKKKCYLYRKKNFWNKIIAWIIKRI